jgi:uroporphyrinogen decarboxylase
MVGWTRNWMGVQNLAYACADDPDLIAEISDTVANLVCWAIDQVAGRVPIDLGLGWEDICFKSGPLVSPRIFEQCCVPAYRKVADKLTHHGCDLYMVDCDGKLDDLMPLWLEGGVNILFPVEIGTWQADPMAFRRRYGKQLRIYGGIDKRELTKGRAAIDAEVRRRMPLMKDGGFIPLPDHLIIPGTPLADYRYYLDRIGELRF